MPDELNVQTLRSVADQTVPVTSTLLLTGKSEAETFPAKMSQILNEGLQDVNLDNFDYLLRVDSDTVLPPDFIEKNIAGEPAVVGYGYAMLIHIKTWRRLMDCKFHPEQDDSYIRFKFMFHKEKSVDYTVQPLNHRSSGKRHSVKYFFDRGMSMYKFGYEPVRVLSKILIDKRNLFTVLGYVKATLKHPAKYEFAHWALHYQLRNFLDFRSIMQTVKQYVTCLGRGTQYLKPK